MGSCASVHKNTPGSAMKLVSFRSKSDNHVIPESPKKDNNFMSPVAAVNGGRSIKSRLSSSSTNRDPGSKEETFFDSQPWIESDCDEDFYSVHGDFTPSRGNTPKGSFSEGIPGVNNPLFEDRHPSSIAIPSPARRRKKLIELFKDSIREEREDNDDGEHTSGNQSTSLSSNSDAKATKSSLSTPYVSGTNSSASSGELTAIEKAVKEKEKPLRATQCCLPGLVSCRSFSNWKKKMSPTVAIK